MKNLKRLLIILLALIVTLCFFACKEDAPCEHVDENRDGICDECEETVEIEPSGDELLLIEEGEFQFQFVLGSDISVNVRKAVNDLAKMLSESFDIEVGVVNDESGNEIDCEVLLGTVTSRGEDYEYNKYTLGEEGYTVTVIDTKVIVAGGSGASLKTAYDYFVEDILGITEETEEIGTVVFNPDDYLLEIQDNYKITSVKIGQNDIAGYTIARVGTTQDHADAATTLQNFLYTKAGYYLPIVPLDEAGDKSIIIRAVNKGQAGSKGFRVVVSGTQLIIECAHNNMFAEAFEEYYGAKLAYTRDEQLVLGAYTPEIDITAVYYSDFGAKGDGKTNDYQAIKDAHDFANEGGQSVYGEAGAKYLISSTVPKGSTEAQAISIRTDTNWNGAEFIIDDSNLTGLDAEDTVWSCNIFTIKSDYSDTKVSSEVLTRFNENKDENGLVIRGMDSENPTTKIDLGLGYPAMITIFDTTDRVYMRWGYTDSAGAPKRELVLIDAEGNVDPSTPLLFDYESLNQVIIHRIDCTPITVENATFRSLASRKNLDGGYKTISRGIEISRPNTTVKKLEHIIENEIPKNEPVKEDANGLCYSVADQGFIFQESDGQRQIYFKENGKSKLYTGNDVKGFTGHSYSGFIQVASTHNTLIENVIFQARVYYEEGTYDISCSGTNLAVFKNCKQSNFFAEGSTVSPNMSKCWGISGTNYCKNLEYHDSQLTRFDAHAGVVNGKIINCDIAILRLIGGGEFLIEGTTIYLSGYVPFQLREDYGATFNGTLIVKDCTIRDPSGTKQQVRALVDASTANWNFGYTTHFPNLVIDNLSIETTRKEIPIVSSAPQTYVEKEVNSHYPSRSIFITDDDGRAVNDPDAIFTQYYETVYQWEMDEDTGLRLLDDEGNPIKILDEDGNPIKVAQYTIITEGQKNINPYVAPDFIEIKNNGDKDYKFTLYDCDFFADTEIIYDEGDRDDILVKNIYE